jgi:HPt (histidine-containing phosphotransfer) domain-containing protein
MTDAKLPTAAANDERHAPDAPATGPVLDAQALAQLAQLDPSGANRLLQRVMVTYRSSLARLMAQLAQARAQSDAASLRLVAHTLKSSSASVGALALSALCGATEQAVRDGRLDGLPALLDQLEAEAVRVDAAVLELLSEPPPPAPQSAA